MVVSGLEGIIKAGKEKPKHIIMEVMIAKLYGFTAWKMIKENEEIKDIPVILLAGKGLVGDVACDYGENSGA